MELTEHGARLTPDDETPSIWALPTPVHPTLLPHPAFLDRRRERDLARAGLNEGAVLGFHGRAGVGRTALLRRLAHGEMGNAFPDGVVSLHAEDQTLDDLLQDLFNAFYATDRPYRPTRAELARRLGARQAVVLLDDARLGSADLEVLLDIMPGSTFVVTSGQPVDGAETTIAVGSLPAGDAVTLVGRRLGRALHGAERDATVQLATTLQGHPGSLLLAAAHARDTGMALPELARRLAAAASPEQLLATDALTPLADADRAVLALLVGLNGAPLALEHLRGIIQDPQVARSVARLKRCGLLQADQPHAVLPDWLAVPLRDAVDTDVSRWMERALAHFTRWAQRHKDDPDLLLADAPALVEALRWAVARRRWREVLDLGKRVQGALLLGGRWGAAAAVCAWLLAGAAELGDLAAQAWALHQRGTQQQLTGDPASGARDLQQAGQLRHELGDKAGAQASHANLPAAAAKGLSAAAKLAIGLALSAAAVVSSVLLMSGADSQSSALVSPNTTVTAPAAVPGRSTTTATGPATTTAGPTTTVAATTTTAGTVTTGSTTAPAPGSPPATGAPAPPPARAPIEIDPSTWAPSFTRWDQLGPFYEGNPGIAQAGATHTHAWGNDVGGFGYEVLVPQVEGSTATVTARLSSNFDLYSAPPDGFSDVTLVVNGTSYQPQRVIPDNGSGEDHTWQIPASRLTPGYNTIEFVVEPTAAYRHGLCIYFDAVAPGQPDAAITIQLQP